MAKVGDTVRFLNTTGGGLITRIEGNIAYVEENGFETPVLVKELVVVMPAGEQQCSGGAKLMFDQKAYDSGNKIEDSYDQNKTENSLNVSKDKTPRQDKSLKQRVPETSYGDKISVTLVFEPSDIKKLSEATFSAVLVNDSNYYLKFQFSAKRDDDRMWRLIYTDEVEPNELIDMAVFSHESLGVLEKVSIQAIAYKKDLPFSLKSPIDAVRRLDLTKFHKLHCFRPGRYFETPVLEFPIINDDEPVGAVITAYAGKSRESVMTEYEDSLVKLHDKFNGTLDSGSGKNRSKRDDNPNKLLPLIQVDLHISELTDTTSGMSNSDMLEMQLDEVRKTMNAHSRRIGQKIVFIHGKGEGVLRKAVISLLKKEFPTAELQDASFREYGFGATLVTIHKSKSQK